MAASLCMFTGRPEEAVAYAQTVTDLEAEPGYHSFFTEPIGFANEATAHLMAGRIDRFVELCSTLANERTTEFRRVFGLCGLAYLLPAVGRVAEAVVIADQCLDTARAYGNPSYIAWAYAARGRAFAEVDPAKALDIYHDGLDYARAQRLPLWEGLIARDGAALEAAHGDRVQGLALFDSAINLCHQSGDITNPAVTLANLALFFDTDEQPDVAATIYGATTPYASTVMVVGLTDGVDHLRVVPGDSRFNECVAAGAALELGEAVRYAQAPHRRHASAPRRPALITPWSSPRRSNPAGPTCGHRVCTTTRTCRRSPTVRSCRSVDSSPERIGVRTMERSTWARRF